MSHCNLPLGFLISSNAKTGVSVNFSLTTCTPTAWCLTHRYARRRKATDACCADGTSTGNAGPITWDTQQAAYLRNTMALMNATPLEIICLADAMDLWLSRRGLRDIRWNGTGDLFDKSCDLVVELAMRGVRVWGFTRKDLLLVSLADDLDSVGIQWGFCNRPFFQGSIDISTPRESIANLYHATERLNGYPALAIAADSREMALTIQDRCYYSARTAFGYHASNLHTVLGLENECPATSGVSTTCAACRHCIEEELVHR